MVCYVLSMRGKQSRLQSEVSMNDSALTWGHKTFDTQAEAKISSLQRIVRFVAWALVFTMATSAWVFWAGDQKKLGPLPAVNRGTILLFVSATAALGVVLLMTALRRLRQWRMTWNETVTAEADEWRRRVITMQTQLTEYSNSEDRLTRLCEERDEEISRLTRVNGTLQEQLDQRKLSEKALQQHQQQLARSKDVLQLHVQARTLEMEKLKSRYEMILNAAGEGICGFDVHGRATFVNPAAALITGWEVSELAGRTEGEIFAGTADSGEGSEKNRAYQRKDGSTFLAELTKTAIEENGVTIGSVVIFKDITERRRAEERLAQKAAELARSNAELEQFAFVASHDLQEPLRKIQAFGDRLKTKLGKTKLGDGYDYLERMQSAAARMQTLINDLLAFSRVIRSSEPFVPVDLTDLTREVLSDLEVRIEKTQATVKVGSMPTIAADPTQLRQLMQNLISNGLKFQPKNAKPVIKIDASIVEDPSLVSAAGLCQITVEDNGIGFDEKYLEKVFAVFQRLHGRSEYEGTGIGLAVCRRIVDRHGGSITAHSKPGEGATFIVTLPVQQSKPETET